MKKSLVVTALLASSLLATNQALADKPKLTPEEFAKAEQLASQIKPPVDLKALLKEADRLGVECIGKLTIKANIKACKYGVETAQADEEIKKLDEEIKSSRERQAKLDEENARLKADTRNKINDIVEKADKKLKETE
jgi:DNA anti-recombination protein RmuC